ncbi:MAG: HAMP domain-containing sensor histidine kinase [Melioribacteraceae bacterium]|nr:HAMP domain-containing sensor histidine kinase [Melioribacteraceae bacterium]
MLIELTEWSEIELGKVKPKFEEVSLAHLVYEILGNLRGDILNKKLKTNVNVSSSLNINCDRTLIGVVLTHVLENSIGYSFSEGNLNIEAERKENQVTLKIIDYGMGMVKEKVDLLNQIETKKSELWSRLKCTPCLDVIICREIMKMHGGSIQFSSQPDKGTTVYLNFSETGS